MGGKNKVKKIWGNLDWFPIFFFTIIFVTTVCLVMDAPKCELWNECTSRDGGSNPPPPGPSHTALVGVAPPQPFRPALGVACGHFLMPFWTFFGATYIGKALIKINLQSAVILMLFGRAPQRQGSRCHKAPPQQHQQPVSTIKK